MLIVSDVCILILWVFGVRVPWFWTLSNALILNLSRKTSSWPLPSDGGWVAGRRSVICAYFEHILFRAIRKVVCYHPNVGWINRMLDTTTNYTSCNQRYTIGWLWGFYILATSKVISGRVPTCDSAHSLLLYSAAPLRDQAAGTMTWYLIQSHYLDIELALTY